MEHKIFYNSKTAKIDNYFTNIGFIICPLAAMKKLLGVLMYQSTVFIVINILIHYENKYFERRK